MQHPVNSKIKNLLRPFRPLVPPRTWVLNTLICRIPLTSARMSLYALLGVAFEDRRTGVIMLDSEVRAPEQLHIGRNSAIGRHCTIDARGGIRIGRDVNISSNARLQTAKHLIDDPDFMDEYSPIAIGDRAWIAEAAIVLGGVTIGEGAVVAAGAVVTKDVKSFSVVGGVPAQLIRMRSEDLRYHLKWRPDWE
jgi:acetyltransferase-like isoleucine patch superfamily enzyme